jgi:putative sigma-54 modulation protein
MNIKTHAVNFDLTDAISEYVEKKVSSLGKFIPNSENLLCEVEIGKTNHHNSGDIFKAEINILIPGGGQVYAKSEQAELYAAIDIVRDEAERVIVSQKNKKDTLYRRGASHVKNLLKRISWN